MKKLILPLCSMAIIIVTIIYLGPITDKLVNVIDKDPILVLKPSDSFTKNKDYLFVQRSNDFRPYSYQDLLNIYYTVIDNGWKEFTFYCPEEYKNCVSDATKISGDELILTHLNNYVHPFNSFTNIKSSINDNGEITLKVFYLYSEKRINEITEKVEEILNSLNVNDLEDYDKIKTVHDYIINNVKYDVDRNEVNDSKYESYNAYGPLFQGYATCNGYTDLMAIFLTKMGFDNYKIATTKDEISYSNTGHIWNAVKVNDEWLHLDLTWDDPVSDDKKDYLFHTYFLVSTEAMMEADKGETVIEEHNFNRLYYLEYN